MADGPDRSRAGPAGRPQRDTDGVLRGQVVLDALVRLLDLERLDGHRSAGTRRPASGRARVFGGQVASQALVAAARTVPAERRVHSLHAYFLRPGAVGDPDRLRGRPAPGRRRRSPPAGCWPIQNGKTIFAMSASFQIDEPGLDHTEAMPDVPDPESLPTLAERVRRDRAGGSPAGGSGPRPFDVRYVNDPPWVVAAGRAAARRRTARSGSGPTACCPTTRCCTSACWPTSPT